jgi:hypothetical protein
VALGVLGALATRTTAFEMCFVPGPHQLNVTLDCDSLNPVVWDNSWYGYRETAPPCTSAYPCLDGFYEWTISASDTEPYAFTGELPGPSAELFLWLGCVADWHLGGWTAAEFGVEATGGDILSFEPLNGVSNLGTPTEMELYAPGCRADPFLAGKWTVLTTVATEAATWGHIKAVYR